MDKATVTQAQALRIVEIVKSVRGDAIDLASTGEQVRDRSGKANHTLGVKLIDAAGALQTAARLLESLEYDREERPRSGLSGLSGMSGLSGGGG